LFQQRFGEVLEVEEGIEMDAGFARFRAHQVVERNVKSEFRVGESGNEDWDVLLVGRFQYPTPGRVFDQMLTDGVIQPPRAHSFIRVPVAEDLFHYHLDVIEVALRFERVIDAVVPGLVEFFVIHCRVVAVMGLAGGLDQAVRHQSAGGDDGLDDAVVDKIANDETLFSNGHGAGEGHHHETVFVARHGLKNISALAELAAGERGLAHGADQLADRRRG
jgi:hypothetical protein